MNLRMLAAEFEEEILFFARVEEGRDGVCLRHLQREARVVGWKEQRALLAELQRSSNGSQKTAQKLTRTPGA